MIRITPSELEQLEDWAVEKGAALEPCYHVRRFTDGSLCVALNTGCGDTFHTGSGFARGFNKAFEEAKRTFRHIPDDPEEATAGEVSS